MRGDEVEGSPLRGGANAVQAVENRKISGCLPGAPAPAPFPQHCGCGPKPARKRRHKHRNSGTKIRSANSCRF